jgi:SAM-dependent methyltransferase
MYTPKTFGRKVDYVKYNFSDVLVNVKSRDFSVLEIGPGMGESIWYLNSQGIRNIDIVDNDREILAYLSKKFKINKVILNRDLGKLDKVLGDYDLIIMVQVLEHIPPSNYKNAIPTLYRHLKKGGTIVLVVPNANNPLGIVERYADLQHYTSFTEQSLRDVISGSGIKRFTFKIRGFEIPPYSLLNIIRICLQKLLHLILLATMIVNGGNFFTVMTPNIMLVIKKD